MTSLNYRSGIGVIALLLLLVSSVVAQDYRGKVQGSVTDEAGASEYPELRLCCAIRRLALM
ncbi:MAG TPA: hypothetical protein VKC61_16730 [Pyrinomonadaceae bacterium]|nr:hypothetical protein [Pyrinomonadaceae bacterium]